MRYRTRQIVLILVTCLAIIGLISACNISSGPVATQSSNVPSGVYEQAASSCCGSAAPTKIIASGCGCVATGANPSVPRKSGCGCGQ